MGVQVDIIQRDGQVDCAVWKKEVNAADAH
jgi:hypothetical protein